MLLGLIPSIVRRRQFAGASKVRGEAKGTIVVFAHPNHLNSPSAFGLVADKLDPWVHAIFDESEDVLPLFYPFRGPFSPRTAMLYARTERLLAICLLQVVLVGVWRFRGETSLKDFLIEATWSLFLRRVNAGLIIGIRLERRLIQASRRRGIRCVEVQHGLLDPLTIDTYWPEAASGSRVVPDLVMTWDEASQSNLESVGITCLTSGPALCAKTRGADERAFWGSNPLQHQRGEESQVADETTGRLLVLLSWGQQGPLGVLDATTDSVLGKLADVFEPTCFVFRLHPVLATNDLNASRVRDMLSERFPGSVVHSPHDYGFAQSCIGCGMLLSRPTASVFEAAMLGVRSCIVGSFPPGGIPDALKTYVAQLGDDQQKIVQYLIHNVQENLPLPPYRPGFQSISVTRSRINLLREQDSG